MRFAVLFIVLILLSSCSWNIYRQGAPVAERGPYSAFFRQKKLRHLIIAELGQPAHTERSPQDEYTDTYYIRRPLPENEKARSFLMLATITFGFSEIIAAPYSWIDHHIPRTKELKIYYDSSKEYRDSVVAITKKLPLTHCSCHIKKTIFCPNINIQ